MCLAYHVQKARNLFVGMEPVAQQRLRLTGHHIVRLENHLRN